MSATMVFGGTSGFVKDRRLDCSKHPAPSVMAYGIGGVQHYTQFWLEIDDREGDVPDEPNKPPYQVPSMAEVAAVPDNGLRVASTFAGCGGSSLGYKMAGFRVPWANEFDAHAAECYRLNAPDAEVDERDVRDVTPADVLRGCGLAEGELDVLDGSPPYQTFSTAGKRRIGDPRSDLFFEFARLLKGVMPRAFVAENVSGLVKGVAKGMFKLILRELRACGYRVEAQMLDAQWLGVPQARQRIIFVGVREDLGVDPAFPKPLAYRYTVRDALPWIVRQCRGEGFGKGAMRDAAENPSRAIGAGPNSGNGAFPPSVVEARVIHDTSGTWGRGDITDKPCPTICKEHGVSSIASVVHPVEKRKFTMAELRRICGFPDDFQLAGSYAQQWARLGNSVPPVMMRHIAEAVRDKVLLT